ncbi:zinc finger protein 271-like [Galleria mellonella]|uniref:Zinc finger protein 271-like n=1 Tax=Galleria mellonella TaxID=7137 RepID=A0A6J3BY79_GALME|nr:zinc finger protein 271-like [Galleria mellonella]XP_031764869.2 zinc finger protein 271-like [Galleria mellonella]XP_031764871.2 zinc finger protein 271-like [Galleria mellonella]
MALQNTDITLEITSELEQPENPDIKQELEREETNITVHIKSEEDDEREDGDNEFENIQLEIKEETIYPCYEKDMSTNPSHSNIMVNLPVLSQNLDIEGYEDMTKNEREEVDATEMENNMEVKEETGAVDESVVTYDYPNFDDTGSMDSRDAAVLGNVETCLQEEINIKTEGVLLDHEKEVLGKLNVKEEAELTVTETHLISNKVINTTSTITNPQDGLIQSQTTKTLVMEILPMPHGSVALSKIGNPEEILPTTYDDSDQYNDMFQLNSITGNVLSLEQEAYGLLKTNTKQVTPKFYACSKCPKTLTSNYALKRHLNVHDGIEKRAMGIIKGQRTRQENFERKLNESLIKRLGKQEKSKRLESKIKKERRKLIKVEIKPKTSQSNTKSKHQSNKVEDKNEKVTQVDVKVKEIKKEGYECTCGKTFRRRSRMETCLRSHDLFLDTNSRYPCLTCRKQFRDKDELALHRKRLHRKKFPCKFCPTDYSTRKELFKHLQIHQKVQLMEYKVISEIVKGKQKLRCFMCAKSYTELSELKSHVMEDHKEPYSCPHCYGTFSKIIDFGNHTKTYHPEVEGQSVLDVLEAFSKLVKAWKCEECGLQFHEADKLALHQIEKHSNDSKAIFPESQFQCADCRRVFISQKGLTSHRRIHHSTEAKEESEDVVKGVMCLECRKICQDMDALNSHMRLHSPDRKYPCKFCDFRFATPEKRKAHAELHTGDMKYVCFICEYQCSSENRLKQHKLSVKHSNMKEFLLTGKPLIEQGQSTSKDECVKKRKKVKKDTDSETSVEVPCDICGDKFSSENEMLEHKQTHPFIEFPNDDQPTRIFFK